MTIPLIAGTYPPEYLDLLRAIGTRCERDWLSDPAPVRFWSLLAHRQSLAYTLPKFR